MCAAARLTTSEAVTAFTTKERSATSPNSTATSPAARYDNPTVRRAVDGTLTAILGREAAARGRYLTMDELIKENKRLQVDLHGLKT